MTDFFLGIDGGQSGTTALIGDGDGRVLGAGTAGPCNHAATEEGQQKLIRAVTDSLAAACMEAGLDRHAVHFTAACCGMSGGPADKQAILEKILPAGVVVITTDAIIALAGATAGWPGIAVIAGTGAIAYGRNSAGHTARAGGWGHIFGDEGSAFDIARQALKAALRQEERWGPPTALHGVLLQAVGASHANQILHRFYAPDWPRDRVAKLAPLIDEAAMAGDPLATEILRNAAQQLAVLTSAVRSQLWQPGEPACVAYIGGVFQSRILLERYGELVTLEEGNQLKPPQYGPAAGALLEAYRAAGHAVPLLPSPLLAC